MLPLRESQQRCLASAEGVPSRRQVLRVERSAPCGARSSEECAQQCLSLLLLPGEKMLERHDERTVMRQERCGV